MRLSSVIVIAAVLHAGVARAQESTGSGEQCWCAPGTAHDGDEVSCDEMCYCEDACGGDSGGGGGGGWGGGPHKPMSEQQRNELKALALVVLFPFGPGLMTDLLFGNLPPTHAESRAKFKAIKNKIAADQKRGKALKVKREGLAHAEDIGETTPDAPMNFQWNPPHLVPSIPYQCDKAWMELPLGVENPGGFSDLDALCNSCPCSNNVSYLAPNPDGTCPDAANMFACAGDDVCCPRDHPIYNPCDHQCYDGSQFGITHDGATCDHYTDCRGAK